MDGLTATVQALAQFSSKKNNPVTGQPQVTATGSYGTALQFMFGTGAGKAQQVYAATRSLAAGASENLDLAGVLTNPSNETSISFSKIKAIVVELLPAVDGGSTGASSITIGNAASNGAKLFLGATTHTHDIFLNGFYAAGVANANGVSITAGSADILKVLNNDGSNAARYRITLIGE